MELLVLLAGLALIGGVLWWFNSPLHAKIRRRRVARMLEAQAAAGVALSRLTQTEKRAFAALPAGQRLRWRRDPAMVSILEHSVVEIASLSTRIGLLWGPLGERFPEADADALAAESARAALADARTPLTAEAVYAMPPPNDLLARPVEEDKELAYAMLVSVLTREAALRGEEGALALDKMVTGLSEADKNVFGAATRLADREVQALLKRRRRRS